jgi:MFS family permease
MLTTAFDLTASMTQSPNNNSSQNNGTESAYAWTRLMVSLALMTIGGSGMYAVTVVLPRVQADFSVPRADASLPYTLTMVGFGLGGILMGKLSDRFGVMVPVLLGSVGLGLGFIAAGSAASLWQFSLAHGVLIGLLGTSATFAPLVAYLRRFSTHCRRFATSYLPSLPTPLPRAESRY